MNITVPLSLSDGTIQQLIVWEGHPLSQHIDFVIKDEDNCKKSEFSLLKKDAAKFAKMLLAISEESK